MNRWQMIQSASALVGLMALAQMAVAADCRFNEGDTVVRTLSLQGASVTVGRDTPNGTEIYRQRFSIPAHSKISCPAGVSLGRTAFTLPSLPAPGRVGSLHQGNVFDTNVPGIGVALFSSTGRAIPYSSDSPICTGAASCTYELHNDFTVEISLIKTGEVAPGTVQGVSLPAMVQTRGAVNPLEVQRVDFSGSLNIVSQTCETPNVEVNMGTHTASDFSGEGRAAKWKDFNIVLRNCPAFHGTVVGLDEAGQGKRMSNVLKYRLDPSNPTINRVAGIVSLDASASGSGDAAAGIALQIANSDGSPLSFSEILDSGIAPAAQGGGNYSIPLKARYLQIGDVVGAGRANASILFTINYQ